MHLYCPGCHSTKIKKNGYTHYGKQNHRCKCCGRQFVRNNTHTKSSYLKDLVQKVLKERMALRLVVACHIGGRGTKAARAFWKKIPDTLKSCKFETDDRDAYKNIIPESQHKTGKDLTYYIEGFNATIRAIVSRLVRKTFSFLEKDK